MKSPKLRIREKDIEAKVVKYAKSQGCLCYKFVSPSNRGVCDRVVIAPGGEVLFLELKAPGQEPTPLQTKFLLDVQKVQGNSKWADSFALAACFIDELIIQGKFNLLMS